MIREQWKTEIRGVEGPCRATLELVEAGMAAKKTVTRRRSAKTGEYVTEEYAKKHPNTTVTEKDKVPVRRKKKKGS